MATFGHVSVPTYGVGSPRSRNDCWVHEHGARRTVTGSFNRMTNVRVSPLGQIALFRL